MIQQRVELSLMLFCLWSVIVHEFGPTRLSNIASAGLFLLSSCKVPGRGLDFNWTDAVRSVGDVLLGLGSLFCCIMTLFASSFSWTSDSLASDSRILWST